MLYVQRDIQARQTRQNGRMRSLIATTLLDVGFMKNFSSTVIKNVRTKMRSHRFGSDKNPQCTIQNVMRLLYSQLTVNQKEAFFNTIHT